MLTRLILLLITLPSFAQERWENKPPLPSGYHYHYSQRIVSYVQLPNDSSEYRKTKVYVQLLPDNGHIPDLRPEIEHRRLINIYLQKTGRKYKYLLNDGSLGREDTNLRMIDRLINQENYLENSE